MLRSGDAASNPHRNSRRSDRARLRPQRHVRALPTPCRPRHARADCQARGDLPLHRPRPRPPPLLRPVRREGGERADPLPAFQPITVRLMARKDARNVMPSLSNDPKDKLLAALNCSCVKGSDKYRRAPMYFDACREWYERLSLGAVELAGTVHEIYVTPRYGGEKVALDYAQDLPPAPRCPL